MEYAINKVTGRLESAEQVREVSRYVCPLCKKPVYHRSGGKRVPHFAHRPGVGTPDCNNFVASHYYSQLQGKGFSNFPIRRLDLRLLLPAGGRDGNWFLELVMPPCRKCEGTVLLDVGGRIQSLDMRGMQQHRHVTVELSTAPYRIISFSGAPDPLYVNSVERKCEGLPSSGAAAFSLSRNSELKGFSRAQKLISSETYAFLWRNPVDPRFPKEMEVECLPSQSGWKLVIFSIPETPSLEFCAWAKWFTGLELEPKSQSINAIWPFLTKENGVNEINCIKSDIILVSAKNIPRKENQDGPTLRAQSNSESLCAVGVGHALSFFLLKPRDNDTVRISGEKTLDLSSFFSFSLPLKVAQRYPMVELSFKTSEGKIVSLPLHQKNCREFAGEARKKNFVLESVSMPTGAVGFARIETADGYEEIKLSPREEGSPHRKGVHFLKEELCVQLASALGNRACQVEVDFGGFGYFCIKSLLADKSSEQKKLTSNLRYQILSYVLQLKVAKGGAEMNIDDATLLKIFLNSRPERSLVPHYRYLKNKLSACGVKLNQAREW